LCPQAGQPAKSTHALSRVEHIFYTFSYHAEEQGQLPATALRLLDIVQPVKPTSETLQREIISARPVPDDTCNDAGDPAILGLVSRVSV